MAREILARAASLPERKKQRKAKPNQTKQLSMPHACWLFIGCGLFGDCLLSVAFKEIVYGALPSPKLIGLETKIS